MDDILNANLLEDLNFTGEKELVTIKGKAQALGQNIEGYRFPDNIDSFPIPSTVMFAPNYTVMLSKKETKPTSLPNGNVVDMTTFKPVNKTYKSAKIVKREGKYLITDEGLYLKWGSYMKNAMLISPKLTEASELRAEHPMFNTADKLVDSLLPNSGGLADIPKTDSSKSEGEDVAEQLNKSKLGKGVRKVQIGFSLALWGVFAFVAYKKWNKSNYWKYGLVGFGLLNAYSTYKAFSKPVFDVEEKNEGDDTPKVTPTPTGLNGDEAQLRKAYNSILKAEKKTPNATTEQKFETMLNQYNNLKSEAEKKYLLKAITLLGETAGKTTALEAGKDMAKMMKLAEDMNKRMASIVTESGISEARAQALVNIWGV